MPTTPEERHEVLKVLSATWDAYPDLSLGRLVCALASQHYQGVTNYPYHLADADLARACRDLTTAARYSGDPGTPDPRPSLS